MLLPLGQWIAVDPEDVCVIYMKDAGLEDAKKTVISVLIYPDHEYDVEMCDTVEEAIARLDFFTKSINMMRERNRDHNS